MSASSRRIRAYIEFSRFNLKRPDYDPFWAIGYESHPISAVDVEAVLDEIEALEEEVALLRKVFVEDNKSFVEEAKKLHRMTEERNSALAQLAEANRLKEVWMEEYRVACKQLGDELNRVNAELCQMKETPHG